MPMTRLTVQGILSVVTILGLLAVAAGLFVFPVPDNSREYFVIILTLVVAKCSTIYDYYFGSSQSSSIKNETIANLTASQPPKP